MRRLGGISARLWRPGLFALLLQAYLLFTSAVFPNADGSIGAPFAAGYMAGSLVTPFGSPAGRLDVVPLVADVLVTAAILAPLGLGARSWSAWVPLVAALVAMEQATSCVARQADAARQVSPSTQLDALAIHLWVAGLVAYAVTALVLWPIRRGWRPPILRIG